MGQADGNGEGDGVPCGGLRGSGGMDFCLGIRRLAAWSVVVMCAEEWSIVGGKTMKWGKSEWKKPSTTAGFYDQ